MHKTVLIQERDRPASGLKIALRPVATNQPVCKRACARSCSTAESAIGPAMIPMTR